MELANSYAIALLVVFILGYTLIILEHYINLNKAASALLAAVICWGIVFAMPGEGHAAYSSHVQLLMTQLAEISQVVLFLVGALAIVEMISAHHGFAIVSSLFNVRTKRQFLWLLGIVAFFLSAILDNLTTTIVMVSLMRKVVSGRVEKWILGSAIVIAANAGGAWTPIGDVTTTMLWIGGQLTTGGIMRDLLIPSVVCLVISLAWLTPMLKGKMDVVEPLETDPEVNRHSKAVLFIGIGALVFVPIFKAITGLPPFMGMLFGLTVLWIYTDLVHGPHQDRHHLRVNEVIRHIDLTSVLFFLGILFAVGALDEVGILAYFAHHLDDKIHSPTLIATLIGFFSAIVDNVPLVAATMRMYSLSAYPVDDSFWKLVAYCAGTGGSMLIIGSAAGVVFMGMERVDFFWYLRKISLAALLGFLGGILVYVLLEPAKILSYAFA